jgi:hypothetical protein
MDEARRVIDRLERIDRMRGDGAPAEVLLDEVRALLADGEQWLASEQAQGLDGARAALDRCREGLGNEDRKEVVARPAL